MGLCCGAVWVRDYSTVGRAMLVTVVTADSEEQQGFIVWDHVVGLYGSEITVQLAERC